MVATHEMNTEDLPFELKSSAEHLICNKDSFPQISKTPPRGAADHYEYKVTIQDGPNKRVIDCDQYSSPKTLWALIQYLEKNSKKSR
jgi:hypothetical protein